MALYSGLKTPIGLTPFLSTINMAGSLLPTVFGKPAEPPKPTNKELLKRAWKRLEEMDQQLLLMAQRCIVLRKAIQEVKDKLLADARKLDQSESF